MKIAFVTPEYITDENFTGGLANYLFRVALSLVKLGHKPIIITSSYENKIIKKNGILIKHVKTNNTLLNKANNLTSGRFLIVFMWIWQSYLLNKVVKKMNKIDAFDIIQYSNYTATGLFRVKEIPAVVRISSYQPLWREGFKGKNNWSSKTIEKLENYAFRKADGVFGPSEILCNVIKKELEIEVELIESPFVMDESNFDRELYNNLLKNKKFLFFFGTIGLLKGVDSIAKIIKSIFDRHDDILFVFAGSDGGYNGISMISYIKKNAEKHKDKVIYVGKINHSKLYPILEKALAIVLPSRIDNFPNTCIEAMAFKKVVIGTRETSFDQLIVDGKSGFLCNKDDSSDLLRVIDKVISLSDKKRFDIGEDAYNRILELAPEKVVKQLVNYYKKIIFNFRPTNKK